MGYGQYGVHAFFVISGYVITYFLDKNNYRIIHIIKFLRRRFIRVNYPYYASIILIILITIIAQMLPTYRGNISVYEIKDILFHLVFLTRFFDENWINPVYWTLSIEFQYYILMGLTMPLMNKEMFKIVLYVILFITCLITPFHLSKF